jgi:hypothetical protein
LSFIPVSFPFESVTGERRKEKSLSGRQQPHVTSIPKHPAVDIVCCSAHRESINIDRVRRNRKSAHAREMGGGMSRESGSERKKERKIEKAREPERASRATDMGPSEACNCSPCGSIFCHLTKNSKIDVLGLQSVGRIQLLRHIHRIVPTTRPFLMH